jgi:hypothetical protein
MHIVNGRRTGYRVRYGHATTRTIYNKVQIHYSDVLTKDKPRARSVGSLF